MEYQDYAVKKPHHIPSFGNWDYYDDIPVTQYFETARHAGLVRATGAGYGCGAHYYAAAADADLFHAPASPMSYHYHHHHNNNKPLKSSSQKLKQQPGLKQHSHHPGNLSSREQRRQVRVCDADAVDAYPRKKPKAVDEDLYKIPPELLSKRTRRQNKVPMSGFWRCCLGMDCIA